MAAVKLFNECENLEYVDISSLDTYMQGGSQYIQDGDFYMENSTGTAVVARIGEISSANPQIDISGEGVAMAAKGKKISTDADKVLKIDLESTTTPADNNYPVYVRKGAIELTAADLEVEAGSKEVAEEDMLEALKKFLMVKQMTYLKQPSSMLAQLMKLDKKLRH